MPGLYPNIIKQKIIETPGYIFSGTPPDFPAGIFRLTRVNIKNEM